LEGEQRLLTTLIHWNNLRGIWVCLRRDKVLKRGDANLAGAETKGVKPKPMISVYNVYEYPAAADTKSPPQPKK